MFKYIFSKTNYFMVLTQSSVEIKLYIYKYIYICSLKLRKRLDKICGFFFEGTHGYPEDDTGNFLLLKLRDMTSIEYFI